MTYKKKSDLTQEVIASIGEVEGTSVQTYTEPRVSVALDQIFAIAFRKAWWPHYMKWYEVVLDGTLGITTTDIGGSDQVQDLRDIRAIIPSGQETALPMLPPFTNPFNLSGTKVRYFDSLPVTHANYVKRLLQFWPKTATDSLKIHARLYPSVIVPDTVLYLDDKLLVNGAAWLLLDDEDINPNAASNRERMFNETFANLMKAYSELPMENSISDHGAYLVDWQAP